jgi:hypothetical protein
MALVMAAVLERIDEKYQQKNIFLEADRKEGVGRIAGKVGI